MLYGNDPKGYRGSGARMPSFLKLFIDSIGEPFSVGILIGLSIANLGAIIESRRVV